MWLNWMATSMAAMGATNIEVQGERGRRSTVSETKQGTRLEQDLLASLRSGYLFGVRDEPLDAAGKRIVRVIQQRLSSYEPCTCTDQTPHGDGTCRACGRTIEAVSHG
jgi:hypothetical protein